MFNAQETDACKRLIKLAIEEDLGIDGDVTSRAVIPADQLGKAVLLSRATGVLAGVAAASLVFEAIDPRVIFRPILRDGQRIAHGSPIASVSGSLRSILAAERTALNFLQHLSGIATETNRYVEAVAGLPCRILDTRKTTPGWRLLEKYAVRSGGGSNHRMGLYDGILIKDNHLAALCDKGDPIGYAFQAMLQQRGSEPVDIEVDNLAQFKRVLNGSRMILLDNMSLDDLREAVRLRNAEGASVLLEASGGITLANVRSIAETGVDRISIGAITHSAPALDIALELGA